MTQDTTSFDAFVSRHNGPRPEDVAAMLATLGYATLDELMAATIPAGISSQPISSKNGAAAFIATPACPPALRTSALSKLPRSRKPTCAPG